MLSSQVSSFSVVVGGAYVRYKANALREPAAHAPAFSEAKSNSLHAVCSSNTPRRQHRQCGATAPTPRPRRLMGLPPATLPIRSVPLPPGTCRCNRSNAPARTLHDCRTANVARPLQRPDLMGLPPGDVANQVRTSPPGDLAGNGLVAWRETATPYSPSGSTSSSSLVSYSTTSYFPDSAPVSRTPSTVSYVDPRGASVSSSSFGDAASSASASESSYNSPE
jgi:hypothetical protein